MKVGSIIGLELNEKNCQISYFNEAKQEPETVETAVDNYQIPLMIGFYQNRWVCGREAAALDSVNSGCVASGLYQRAIRQEKIKIGGQICDAVLLLAKFVQSVLSRFSPVDYLTFTVPYTDIDINKMLKGVGQFAGVPKERVCVQDYKESFCHYMFYQPKELWQYESALFYCDRNEIRAYVLRKLRTFTGGNLSGIECGQGQGCGRAV